MSAPLPILFTIPNFITVGSGMVLFNIVSRLDRKLFAPSVCVLRTGGALEKEFERLNIPLFEAPFVVPSRPYWNLLVRAWRAAQAFRPHGFILWQSWHYADDYTEPVIARLAGARAWVFTKKAMGWGSRAWLLRSLLATRIAVDNSEMPGKFFSKWGLAKKVKLIHHGIPTEQFSPGVPPRLRLRQRLGIPEDAVVVACVAQLVPVKGHPTLLEALASAPNAPLLIAGAPLDREYTALLHQQVAQSGLGDRVHFLGGVKEVPALLAESDIYVLPTWAKWRMEGCPVALLEAMSCGKACIATDIPGSRDLVENGKSGLLVAPEDPAALAAALKRLIGLAELRKQLGQAARRRVLENFTIEKEVAAHEALYDEILGGTKVKGES